MHLLVFSPQSSTALLLCQQSPCQHGCCVILGVLFFIRVVQARTGYLDLQAPWSLLSASPYLLLNMLLDQRVHLAILGCLLLQHFVLFLQSLDLCLILCIVLHHGLHLLLLLLHKVPAGPPDLLLPSMSMRKKKRPHVGQLGQLLLESGIAHCWTPFRVTMEHHSWVTNILLGLPPSLPGTFCSRD